MQEVRTVNHPRVEPILDDPHCGNRGIHKPHDHEVKWYGHSKLVPSIIEIYRCPGLEAPIHITRRKLCKEYDAVCLEGGCGYCDSGRWRNLNALEKEVRKLKDLKLLGYFLNGKRHDFYNAPIEFSDGSRRRPYRPAQA